VRQDVGVVAAGVFQRVCEYGEEVIVKVATGQGSVVVGGLGQCSHHGVSQGLLKDTGSKRVPHNPTDEVCVGGALFDVAGRRGKRKKVERLGVSMSRDLNYCRVDGIGPVDNLLARMARQDLFAVVHEGMRTGHSIPEQLFVDLAVRKVLVHINGLP
jgi:hypothetical protein